MQNEAPIYTEYRLQQSEDGHFTVNDVPIREFAENDTEFVLFMAQAMAAAMRERSEVSMYMPPGVTLTIKREYEYNEGRHGGRYAGD